MKNSNAPHKDEHSIVQLVRVGGLALLAAGGGMGLVVVFIIGGILAFR